MLDEQFFRFPLISVPAQTLDRDPVDRRQEWQSRGRSSLQTLLSVKFPLLSCNWLMLWHSLCDVGAGCWLPPGLLLSVFIQWVLTLTRILNILPWPSHNISHNMPPPPHTAMPRLTCSAREKISIRNSKTISGGIKSSKHSRKKFNKARMLSA